MKKEWLYMWASNLQFFRLISPSKEISYDEKETEGFNKQETLLLSIGVTFFILDTVQKSTTALKIHPFST